MEGDSDARLSIAQLEAAINHARLSQPARGAEATLSRDVALLGALYGRLIWERRGTLALAEASDEERAALARWTPST